MLPRICVNVSGQVTSKLWYHLESCPLQLICTLQIMASMIEEADDVSQPLLDVILECVTSPKMEEQREAYR